MKKTKVAALITAALVMCTAWNVYAESAPPLPQALDALESGALVGVSKRCVLKWFDGYYVFEPVVQKSGTGFIFYPGGLVDPRAYAPHLRAIAEQGHTVFLVPMPFDLAVFGWDRAQCIIKRHASIRTWAVGGHSFGGVMACRYGGEYTADIDGVVLWASYPSEYFRIDDTPLACMSIYGERDGLTTLDEIEESHLHLPSFTQFVEIRGGNHTQFGWYGETGDDLQEGDNPAAISRQDQQDRVVDATVDFLDGL